MGFLLDYTKLSDVSTNKQLKQNEADSNLF